MMRKMNKLMLAASLLGLSSASWAGSLELESFACGQKAIEVGMSIEQIKAVCDSAMVPAFISKTARPALRAAADGSKNDDLFEKWMYRTSGKNDTHVLIKNGQVVRIFTHE